MNSKPHKFKSVHTVQSMESMNLRANKSIVHRVKDYQTYANFTLNTHSKNN